MTALKKLSPEWIAESRKIPALLQAALNDPDDIALSKAMIESLEKLGIVVPNSPTIKTLT
jgi:hypothetical protein